MYITAGGLAIRKKIAGKCRRPFSDPPGDLIDRWEHRDGRGRAPRANGSDIPFSAKRPISAGSGRGLTGMCVHSPRVLGGVLVRCIRCIEGKTLVARESLHGPQTHGLQRVI